MKMASFARGALVAGLAFWIGGCAVLTPPTPKILQRVTAGRGGWASAGCPPASELERNLEKGDQEASSPELSGRLRSKFPPGTPSKTLISYLSAQGFSSPTVCGGDRSIFRMSFNQAGGSPLGPFPIFAVVAWKQDDQGLVVWTKGQVSFTGL